MITEQDLQEAIAECEGVRNPNANTCIKLAAFYTIRNELFQNQKSEPIVSHSFSSGYTSESEFGKAIEGIDTNEIIKLMDELMDAVKVMNPRLYEAVMRKIRGIA